MNRNALAVMVCSSLISSLVPLLAGASISSQPSKDHPTMALNRLPLSFEANQGQADPQVKYLLRAAAGTLFLTPTEAVVALRAPAGGDALRLKMVGANPRAQVAGLEEQPGKVNYYRGHDRRQWHLDVPTYARVQYHEIYPGIDLVYYGGQRLLEYDFVVSPHANPRAIRLAFDGADPIKLDAEGNLLVSTPHGQVQLGKPRIYQETEQGRRAISGGYVIRGAKQAEIQVAQYDTARPLVIDPTLVYATYLGGSDQESSGELHLDTAGNAYVSGQTVSMNFPTQNAAKGSFGGGDQDMFVAKISSSGSLVWSTYLGGNGNDQGTTTLDSNNNLYAVGQTTSSDFPTANAFQSTYGGGNDLFVTKLNSSGQFVFSTYLGGSGDEDGESYLDGTGNIVVSGQTSSPNFPTQNAFQSAYGGGAHDVYVAKFSATGSLVFSTLLGGGDDESGVTSLDSSGNVVVFGQTSSTDFPTRNAHQSTYGGGTHDVFVTKLPAAGGPAIFSTYLGGSDNDTDGNMAMDSTGNLYVCGNTTSSNFPTLNAVQTAYGGSASPFFGAGDVFVAKYSGSGSFLYSTYLGGSGDEQGTLQLDRSDNLIVSGHTTSPNYPTSHAAQSTYGGDNGAFAFYGDVFVTKLNPSGQYVFSTYLGGNGADLGFVEVQPGSSGNIFVIGDTASTNFPTVNAVQPTFGGSASGSFGDVFVTKLTPAGAIAYSTYLGGSDDEFGSGLVDSNGNVVVSGTTMSANYPTFHAAQAVLGGNKDVFITKLNSSGQFVFSTYLGGSGDETGFAFPDTAGNIYCSGQTGSADFPTKNPLQPAYGGGSNDVFLTKLDPTGQIVYSTWLGGSGDETGSAFPMPPSSVYVWGQTTSPDFPVHNALQSAYGGQQDVFVVKIDEGGGGGCTYLIQPLSLSFGNSGGSSNVSVTAGSGCAWTANSNDGWINVSSGASGSGNGIVGISVSVDPTGNSRTGTVTIASQTLTVFQSGAACTYSILPTNVVVAATATSGSVAVTAPGGCAWTANSNDGFITLIGGASGSGNGSVDYSIDANAANTSRTGSVTIAGLTFTVRQNGAGSGGPLTVTSFAAKLNFAKANADSFSAGGTLDLPADFSPAGQAVTLDAGGVSIPFTLDPKGSAKTPLGTFKLSNKKGAWSFAAKLKGGSWAANWLGLGFVNDNVSGVSVNMPVTLTTSAGAFTGTRTVAYSAKAGKSGSAK